MQPNFVLIRRTEKKVHTRPGIKNNGLRSYINQRYKEGYRHTRRSSMETSSQPSSLISGSEEFTREPKRGPSGSSSLLSAEDQMRYTRLRHTRQVKDFRHLPLVPSIDEIGSLVRVVN